MKVSLVVPTRNELEGLRHYLPFLLQRRWHEVIVLDGGSTDGTPEYAASLGCKVVVQPDRGMRDAYLACCEVWSGDAIVVFSPDGNSLPEALDVIITKLEQGYDMVIASRYKDGARSYDDTLLSGFGNRFFTLTTACFGFPYSDAMVMYRGFRRDLPTKLGLDVRRSRPYERTLGRYVSWEPLMSIRAAKAQLHIAEVGFDEPRRLDQQGAGLLLPATRIYHFRAGFACLVQLAAETVRWNWRLRDGSHTRHTRRFHWPPTTAVATPAIAATPIRDERGAHREVSAK
ncbi:MAG: glycosyltransferase family 2 protein [Polyangiales bacterium]